MTVADGRGQKVSELTGVLTVYLLTSWAPMVIPLAVAVLSGGDNVLILGSKALREQLSIVILERLRVKALGHGARRRFRRGSPFVKRHRVARDDSDDSRRRGKPQSSGR